MKKRSEPLERPYVFFVDRCLGKETVPEALRRAAVGDERVEVHDKHFAPSTRDIDWLTDVGRRGWVVLSQDMNITRNPLEQHTLLAARVAFFGLSGGNAPGTEKAKTLVSALPQIRRALARFGLPLIATVSQAGDVTVKWADGVRLDKPKRIEFKKPR